MRKIRGFKLGKRLVTAYRRLLWRRRTTPAGYLRLDTPSCKTKNPISKLTNLCDWGRQIKTKAKRLCSKNPGPWYLPMGQEPLVEKPVAVPKGHMAVYVGQKDGDGEFSRILVPVIYFNHPLFGQLLREAEEEYGFQHPGGITIPCRISEFEKVQTSIAAGKGCRRSLTWKRHN